MCFTVHFTSPTATKSHIEKGFSTNREKEEKKSCKIFCNAKAIAIPQIHKLASRGVISMPRFVNTRSKAVIQITIFTVNLTIFLVISEDLVSLDQISLVIKRVKKLDKRLLDRKTINTINDTLITAAIVSSMCKSCKAIYTLITANIYHGTSSKV